MTFRIGPRLRRVGVVSLLCALSGTVVTACSSGTSSEPGTPSYPTSTVPLTGSTPSSSTSAYPGSMLARDKSFSAVLPSGWTPVKSSLPGVVAFVQAPTVTHGVRSNLSVIRQAGPGASLADVITQSGSTLRGGGYTVREAPDAVIGGIAAQGLIATKTVQKQQVSERQYFVPHARGVYVTTMTSSAADAGPAASTASTVYGTWAWSRS